MQLSANQTVELVERVARIDANLTTLSKRLLGNGQPGEIDQIDRRLRKAEQFIVASRARTALLGAAGGAVVSSAILILRVLLHG